MNDNTFFKEEDAANRDAMQQKLCDLLESTDIANVLLGIELIKVHGFQKAFLTYSFLLKNFHSDKGVRHKAGLLFTKTASAELKSWLKAENIKAGWEENSEKRIAETFSTLRYFEEIDEQDLGRFFLKLTGRGGKFCLEQQIDEPQNIITRLINEDTKLSFRDFNLNNLPEEIGLFSEITSLNVSGNSFTHLPESISNLKKIQEFYYNGTPLSKNELERLKKIFPRAFAKTFFDQGTYLLDARRFEKALEEFEKALKIDPTYPEAWNYKGYALRFLKRDKEAVECYKRCLILNRTDTFAWANLAESLCNLREFEQSLDAVESGLDICQHITHTYRTRHDESNLWFMKGLNYFWLNRHQEAIQANNQCLVINNYAGAWYNKACSYSKLNDKDDMLKCLEEALIMDREHYIEMLQKDEDKDFDTFYNDPDYLALIEKYK